MRSPSPGPAACHRLLLGLWGWLVLHVAVASAADLAAPQIVTGEINGARYAIARPDQWNRHVLIHAHGLRPDDAPLVASLDPHEAAYARLLAEGWIVAATSYRRNGIIIRDAIADIDNLRDHIERNEGAPALVILLGESMGGAIVTLLAEQAPVRYHGAIAIGAALNVREANEPIGLTGAPRMPVIFLTNQSELGGPANYVASAATSPVPPALWTVARDGHVNVNQAERSQAIEGLITWITTNAIARPFDGTINLTPSTSDTVFTNGAAIGRVHEVTNDYGNIFTSFTTDDFSKLRVEPGTKLTLEAAGKSWKVHYGSDYGDVAKGEWIAFPRAEGVILLAINHGNAAATANVRTGDRLTVRPSGD